MVSLAPLSFDTYFHIYNRGNNRENIFYEERNYTYFLTLYAKYIQPIAETFAYCLLCNHFHLFVRIKSELEITDSLKVSSVLKEISDSYPSHQFSKFFNAYAKGFNKAYGRTGSLFQHPFGRVPVTKPSQYERLIVYIHQNPQKHGFVRDFREWRYSSYKALLSKNDTHIKRSEVLDWFGGREVFSNFHNDFIIEPDLDWFSIVEFE